MQTLKSFQSDVRAALYSALNLPRYIGSYLFASDRGGDREAQATPCPQVVKEFVRQPRGRMDAETPSSEATMDRRERMPHSSSKAKSLHDEIVRKAAKWKAAHADLFPERSVSATRIQVSDLRGSSVVVSDLAEQRVAVEEVAKKLGGKVVSHIPRRAKQ